MTPLKNILDYDDNLSNYYYNQENNQNKKSLNKSKKIFSLISSPISPSVTSRNSFDSLNNLLDNSFTHKIIPKKTNAQIQIIIVDDCPINRKLLKHMLKYNENIDTTEISDGLEFIEIIDKEMDEKNNICDIVILDNLMPNMSGSFAIKLARKIGFNRLVIGLTGNNSESETAKFLNNGVNIVLYKPLDKEKIVSLINFYIENPNQNYNSVKLNINYNKIITLI